MTGSIKFIGKNGIRFLTLDSSFFKKTTVERNGKPVEITPREKAEGLAHDFKAHTFELTSDKKVSVYTQHWDSKHKRLTFSQKLTV